MFKDKRSQEIIGIVFVLFSVLIVLSLASFDPGDYRNLVSGNSVKNLIGPLGSIMAHIFRVSFGTASYLLVPVFVVCGITVIKKGSLMPAVDKVFSLFFLTIALSAFLSLVSGSDPLFSGGYVGVYQHHFLRGVAGPVGATLIIGIMNLAGLILLGIFSLSMIIDAARGKRVAEMIMLMRAKMKEKKIKKKVPLNSIGADDEAGQVSGFRFIERVRRNAGERIPWIVKTQVVLAAGADPETKNPVKYLEMQVPLALRETRAGKDAFPGLKESYAAPRREARQANEERSIDADSDENGFTVKKYPHDDGGGEIDDIDDAEFTEDDDGIYYADYEGEKIEVRSESEKAESASDIKINRIKSIREDEVRSPDEGAAAGAAPDEEKEITSRQKKPVRQEDEDLSRPVEMVFSEINLNRDYIIPMDFLKMSVAQDSESWLNEVKKNSALLVHTLADFGIESRVVNVNRGPVITLFELQIAPGIKVNRIVGLADDIAMALAAYRVRIVAPIPGKSAIGVEIPNRVREKVTLGDVIRSDHYQKKEGLLKVALGKDILGKPVMLDLKKLPHLLIAGATGSGKSVCVNTIITSLVYDYDPNYVRFILVDPKMVELQLYNGLPHLLTPVITEPYVAPNVLKWAVYEMERRYRLLSEMNTRDMERYNEKIKGSGNSNEHLPYIIIIIDELADLMMVACKEIEGFITRIAQKARAVGIHLVLATQRPSVDIITGIIKANFPARIAFQVAQKTDSRTIIDQNGAEKLLGKGDMLFQSPNGSYPVRIQGAYVSEDEIMSVVEHLSCFGEPDYIDIEESLFNAESTLDEDVDGDELFVEALKIVEETRKASASYLQRRLSIGYNRAARIIEMMEDRGYIGPQQGSKPREILI